MQVKDKHYGFMFGQQAIEKSQISVFNLYVFVHLKPVVASCVSFYFSAQLCHHSSKKDQMLI